MDPAISAETPMLQLLLLMISRFAEFATRKIGSAYRTSRRMLGSAAISTPRRFGTALVTLSAKLYQAVDRVMKRIEIGSLVRIRRKGWSFGGGEIGVVVDQQYLTYDQGYCKWRVLVGDEMRVVYQSNLFPIVESG